MNPSARRGSTVIGNNNRNCGNVDHSYNTYKDCQFSAADERGQILQWLSPLPPKERHGVISLDRVDRIGDWLLQTDGFVGWRGSETRAVSRVLFCCGGPGTGKTHLSSLVIDTLCDQNREGDVVVACMYCDFQAPQGQSEAGVLAALLRQVVAGLELIPSEIQHAFEQAKRQDGRALRLLEIRAMLIESVSSLRQVFICIDALDEFPSQNRPGLWKSLRHILLECPNTHLFVTGRPHIENDVREYFNTGVATILASPPQEDIGRYLEKRLESDLHPDAMDKELRAEILRIIPERISEMFLLVSLVMDAILDQTTRGGRSQTLHDMTKGLNIQAAYRATLARMKEQKGDQAKLGMRALMWISRSHRPLKAEELCHALAVEVGATYFDLRRVPTPRTLLACTLGLVAIDQQTSTFRLMHFTLQEYLEGHSGLLTTAHSIIAETCLTYLNTLSARTPTEILDDTLLAKSFLEYASCHWGAHASKETTENVKSLALQLLEQYPDHISASILLRETLSGPLVGFSGLHCIAYLGIDQIAVAMDQKKWDWNGRDSTSATPLMWAARYRNYNVAKFLLDQEDVDPNLSDNDGLTPLLWAARSGEEALVRLLVERRNVDPDSSDDHGRTPLSFASQSQHEEVVKLLLQRKHINPNSSDRYGQTPLLFAAEEGHEGVVELLLKHKDIDPNSFDHNGRTPLSFAACSGNEGVVKLFLKHEGVHPDSPNNNGRTPLSFAAWSGNEGSVRLLLELGGVDPNTPDEYGQTPLLWAARSGQRGTVRLLLKREDVAPNTPNNDGQTPLLWAARSGHEGVVEMLLVDRRVDPNPLTNNGQTPLSAAARSGHEGIVRLLLGSKDVNPNSSDNSGRTPLSRAAIRGHEGVVKLLLKHGDANPNSPDKDGQTPVSLAVMRGYEGIVKLLTQLKQLSHQLPQDKV